jgi:hypothetical protein
MRDRILAWPFFVAISDEELEQARLNNLEAAAAGVKSFTTEGGEEVVFDHGAAAAAISREEHRRSARTRGGPLAFTLTKVVSRGLQ